MNRAACDRYSPHRRRWPLSRMFAVAVASAAALAMIGIGASAVALWRLADARSDLVEVAGPALLSAQQMSEALWEQQTAVRSFAATGEPRYRDAFQRAVQAQDAALADLQARDAAGLGVEAELAATQQAYQGWRADYAQLVVDGRPASSDTGRVRFQQVRMELRAVTTELTHRDAGATDRMDGALTFLMVVGAVVAVVLALCLAAAGVALRRSVLDPISELVAGVREVVSGDVQRPVRAGGPREIADLGVDVEAMRRHILRDLDEAQAANRRLDEQARELERSNRDLEQFASVASHDLQEPLRKVASFCQLLQRRYAGQLDERADQYIEFAVDGAQRMQQLIRDLLEFSRVGRTTEGFQVVDLGTVAAAAVSHLESAREDTGGRLVIGALPSVSGDPVLLRALLSNLLGNGLKFHREGVPPVVRVGARREGSSWEISVSDNGIGISGEYADKVFVLFQRLHGRDAYPGTGIGLALAKKIVEFHGGRIGLAPPAGPGTIIRFTLPALPEEASP